MKHFLLFVALFVIGSNLRAQTVDNQTSCDIKVTPICYDPMNCGTNCNANPDPGQAITYTSNTSGAAPVCGNPMEVVVAYEICWDAPSICPPTTCITVGIPEPGGNMWGLGCDSCWSGFTPPGPWLWPVSFPVTLTACQDCVQPHGGNANVNVNTSGDVTVGP